MKRPLIPAAAIAACAALSCGRAPRAAVHAAAPKLIVLGIDGMDPAFLERHWSDLPNLDKLHRTGTVQRLATVMPPQSPVAWSTFITGMSPGGHGVWDFIHRSPETLQPLSSMGDVIAPKWQIPLGPYLLPVSKGRIETFRIGKPFWEVLGEHGIPATILRMPTNFPALEDDEEQLSGMGTPDLRGTFGTFSYFTDEAGVTAREVGGGRFVPVRVENHHATLRIIGPPDSLRRDGADTSIDVAVDVDPSGGAARFESQGHEIVLAQGEWSGWIHARFPLMPGVSAAGMYRIYAKELHPGFRVYVSPINLDPSAPELPIANPPEYARELADAVGPYYTQGMPEDTAALREGVFTLDEYIGQSRLVSQEHLALLRYAVDHLRSGFLFFHFFGVDQDSHILWARHEDKLLDTYRLVDNQIGWVREHAPDVRLMVMSDHGFTTFDRAVHVNRWLVAHGLMTLKDPGDTSDAEGFRNVDWTRTRAYAVGLNGVYLNLAGREKYGIVEPLDVDGVIAEIRDGLKDLRDPETGENAIAEVYETAKLYHGAGMKNAPDLLVGYRPGYRASWQTAVGGTPPGMIVANDDAWIGDHCIDARFVPGVLLANWPLRVSGPSLADLPEEILKDFGLAPPREMAGL
jgi:predicted AlkP superfamily phosphohydrolase/phosphomutase